MSSGEALKRKIPTSTRRPSQLNFQGFCAITLGVLRLAWGGRADPGRRACVSSHSCLRLRRAQEINSGRGLPTHIHSAGQGHTRRESTGRTSPRRARRRYRLLPLQASAPQVSATCRCCHRTRRFQQICAGFGAAATRVILALERLRRCAPLPHRTRSDPSTDSDARLGPRHGYPALHRVDLFLLAWIVEACLFAPCRLPFTRPASMKHKIGNLPIHNFL